MNRILQKVGFAILFTIITCSESLGSDERVTLIKENLENASSLAEIRAGMQELAQIGSSESAEAYSKLLEQKIVPLGLPLTPFFAPMYEFPNTPQIAAPLVAILKQLWTSQTDRNTRVMIAGLLARFDETSHVSWLISEHGSARQDSSNLYYSATILRVLSKANNEEASNYVVDYVLQNSDPTLKLAAEGHMRETGNPRAIDIMRRWPMVENGDVDLLLAEHYLESIIAFGDTRDLPFVNWLDHNAKRIFPLDGGNSLRPLLTDAKTAIETRSNASNASNAGRVWRYAMTAIAILFIVVVVGYVFTKRKANRIE